MTSPALEEQILEVVETKLETIDTGNGFRTTITEAYRALAGTPPLSRADADRPFIEIRHAITTPRWHIRGANEGILEVNLILVTDQDDDTIRNLLADATEVIDANTLWNDGSSNLADRTWVGERQGHEPEIDLAHVSASLQFFVKYYEDRTDIGKVKAI